LPFRRHTAIALICIIAIIGIICGRQGWTIGLEIIALTPLILLSIFRIKYFMWCLLIGAFALGIWRGSAERVASQVLQGLVGQTVTLTGVVADDPATSPKNVTNFTVSDIRLGNKSISGSLPVYTYPVRVHRGYQIQLQGKVKPGFGKYVASISYPQLVVISDQQSELERTRARFFAGMKTALGEPAASFGLGLLVGIRALIPKDLQTTLALVGLSHLVAVSGYNLTIIVRAVERLCLRFGRGIALVVSLWVIAGFMAVTGASASIVRAAVVSVLLLLAAYYGRNFKPVVLLLLAAAATALVKPSYLTDLGWLLSFLAFYGILVLTPAIWTRFGEPKSIIIKLLTESLSAQIMTLPLILFIFGQLSIVAPLSNVLILPLVPLAMALCLIAGLAGMLIPAWCGWFAWPAQLLLDVVMRVINAFAALPWAGTTIYIDAKSMIIAYISLLLITVGLSRANKDREPILHDPSKPAITTI
jgi:competence protein ComEC